MPEHKSCRNMIFTLNNYSDDEIAIIKTKFKYNYLVFGFEVGEEGTPHLQGYVEFKNSVLFSTLKNKLPRAHWDKRRGTPKEASDYCKKDDKFFEDGEISNQGARSDLDSIREMIASGTPMVDVAEADFLFYCRYNRAFEKYAYLCEERSSQENREIETFFYWGDTFTGKSYEARQIDEKLFSVSEGITGMWWTGYSGQKTVLFDDFRGTIPLHILLKYLDKYPVQVPVHNGYKWLRATKIIITSNLSLDEMYKNCDDRSRDALARRIHNIKFFEKRFIEEKK